MFKEINFKQSFYHFPSFTAHVQPFCQVLVSIVKGHVLTNRVVNGFPRRFPG